MSHPWGILKIPVDKGAGQTHGPKCRTLSEEIRYIIEEASDTNHYFFLNYKLSLARLNRESQSQIRQCRIIYHKRILGIFTP
jgi:hypothetical protein